MKLSRRLALALLPLATFVALLLPSQALATTGTYVFDEMDILESSEFEELESQAANYAQEFDTGVYLLITGGMGEGDEKSSGSERREFARDFYQSQDLGVGANQDGIILVIAMYSREYVTVKHFPNSSTDPFSDDSVDTMEDEVEDRLHDNEWYEAARTYYDIIGEHLAYFANHGEQWEEPDVFGLVLKIVITVLVPLLIAGGVVGKNKEAMQTARRQTEAADYLKPGSFALSAQSDVFVNRTITSTPRPKHNDDDGGGWSDMGGGFSGSDGGDF